MTTLEQQILAETIDGSCWYSNHPQRINPSENHVLTLQNRRKIIGNQLNHCLKSSQTKLHIEVLIFCMSKNINPSIFSKQNPTSKHRSRRNFCWGFKSLIFANDDTKLVSLWFAWSYLIQLDSLDFFVARAFFFFCGDESGMKVCFKNLEDVLRTFS